jgi:hypothetical protein
LSPIIICANAARSADRLLGRCQRRRADVCKAIDQLCCYHATHNKPSVDA